MAEQDEPVDPAEGVRPSGPNSSLLRFLWEVDQMRDDMKRARRAMYGAAAILVTVALFHSWQQNAIAEQLMRVPAPPPGMWCGP